MDLSEKEWDEAKQFGQYLLEQGEDESEAVVEFRRQDLAAYLGMLGFCHKGSDDVQLDAAKSTAAIAWGWLWHVTTADDRVKTARHLLGQMLDKDLKLYGIQTAKAEAAQVNVQEIEAAMLRGEFGDAILPMLTAAPQPAEQHPDDAAVDRFSSAMKAKLAKKRAEGRSGWETASASYLSALLHEHVIKGDPVDVANLAMMLHQKEQGIEPVEQPPAPDVAGLVTLLEHARCNTCDGSGALYDGHGQVGQCQWCHERSEALAAHRKQGGGDQ